MGFSISILGLGLMGGSLAMALRGFKQAMIVGADRNAEVCDLALASGVVDAAYTDFGEAVRQTDLVIFAVYAQHIPAMLASIRSSLRDGVVIADICGVKSGLIGEPGEPGELGEQDGLLGELLPPTADYISIHPMAGKEQTGFANADAAMFAGAGFIICPWPRTNHETVELMRELASYIGADRIAIADPAEHDRQVAYTSALPHIAAAGLCLALPPQLDSAFIGGAWRDGTRVADIDAQAWAGLFVDNRENCLLQLDSYLEGLGRVRQALEESDVSGLERLLQVAGENKRSFGKVGGAAGIVAGAGGAATGAAAEPGVAGAAEVGAAEVGEARAAAAEAAGESLASAATVGTTVTTPHRIPIQLAVDSYDIIIGDKLLDQAAQHIQPLVDAEETIALVTDSNVWDLYGKALTQQLQANGIKAQPVVVAAGEQSKSIEELEALYDAFAKMQLRRSGLVIACGGGVVGDLGGFAAATYLRGIPYIQIPTTLLAQVDASVGGKTAVNLASGKNQAGAFYQPRLVIIDPGTLETLPPRELSSGLAEVIKYGAISSPQIIETCRQQLTPVDTTKIIAECCRIKAGIVERDEREGGERLLLNFGHSFGHAIEKAGGYEKYRHGEAVAIGMLIAARLGEQLGLTEPGTAEILREALQAQGLATSFPDPLTSLLPAIESDKKSQAGLVRMVLLKRIGEAFVYPVSFADLAELVERIDSR